MRESCLTEEVMQQFVDGELSTERTEEAASHLAACDRCAGLLGEVEEGNALLAEAFAPELALPVPTASLRERLDAEITRLAPQSSIRSASARSRLRAWFASLSFTPQQSLGFASLAVVIIFAAIFAAIQLQQRRAAAPARIAASRTLQPLGKPAPEAAAPIEMATPEALTPSTAGTIARVSAPRIRRAPVVRREETPRAGTQPATATATATAAGPKLLPGEKGYLEAIASLTTAIEANRDDVLKPTVRADYERNLAVVDQAIATTRQQVKKNPNNRDAMDFMYTAYQNKIDLLSAVADQTRVASR